MKKTTGMLIFLVFVSLLGGCGIHVKVTRLGASDKLENRYVSFSPPDASWYYTGEPWILQANGKAQFARINSNPKGGVYDIGVEAWPFKWLPWRNLFDKNADYETVLNDEDMALSDNDREQRINYSRLWISYIGGMKCYESVFSRSRGGMLKDTRNKNYSITCGYYDKIEEKRLLSLSYRYNYAGGSIRYQKDKDIPGDELMPVSQIEMGLKQAVKRLVDSIQIKNLDRERMEREGLMHYDRVYEISPY